MPCYHGDDGKMITGRFLPGTAEEIVVPLGDAALGRKRLMTACFHTQREMLPLFALSPERFRLAPPYRFAALPHSGTLLYETFGWGITGADWRRCAMEALGPLSLSQCP